MKRILLIALSAVILLPFDSQAKKNESEELKVMSYNIRMGIAKDGTNSWEFRCPATIAMLKDQQPDILGHEYPWMPPRPATFPAQGFQRAAKTPYGTFKHFFHQLH